MLLLRADQPIYSTDNQGGIIYEHFIMNTHEELDLMQNNNEWSNHCPTWFVESYDAYGNRKPTCVFGEANQFMCNNCGCNIYPSILTLIEKRKPALINKLGFIYLLWVILI
jgi:hypothetical protein